jgi:hypothetical protein
MRTLLKVGTVVGVLLLPAPVLAGPIHLIGSFYAQEDYPIPGDLTFTVTNDSDLAGFGGLFDFTIELHTDGGLVPLSTVADLSAGSGANIHDVLADFSTYTVIDFATLVDFQFSRPGTITYQIASLDVTSPEIGVGQTLSIFYEPAAAVPDRTSTSGVLLTALGALGACYLRCRPSS